MHKMHVTLAIDNLWFGLTNYTILLYTFDHKSLQAHNSIENVYRIFEYSFIKQLFIRFHIEYSF